MQKKLKIVLTSLNKSKKSAHCLRCAGHAPVGLSKRGRDAILYLQCQLYHAERIHDTEHTEHQADRCND